MSSSAADTDLFQGLPCLQLIFYKLVIACPIMLFYLTVHHRMKIVKEKALPDIENYMFENHDQLRQAATECMCNLVVNKEVTHWASLTSPTWLWSVSPWDEAFLNVLTLHIMGWGVFFLGSRAVCG